MRHFIQKGFYLLGFLFPALLYAQYKTGGSQEGKLGSGGIEKFQCCRLDASFSYAPINCGADSVHFTSTVIGRTPPFTYLWSFGNSTTSTNANPVILYAQGGTYTVTVVVTDAIGCTATATQQVVVPQPLVAAIAGSTNVSCNGGNDGSATLSVNGGTTPYTYLWNIGTQTQNIASLQAGTYSVTVTDANGCTATASATITEPTLLTANIASTNVPCNGGSNGSIDLTVTGGTTSYSYSSYSWSNGATTEDLNNLSAGTYSVTVTDANGCTATASATITEPTPIIVGITATNVTCTGGGNDGSINLSVTGGTSPYTYLWSNGDTTPSIVNLQSSIYNVTVTDANGCTATATQELVAPVCPTIKGILYDNAICGSNTVAGYTLVLRDASNTIVNTVSPVVTGFDGTFQFSSAELAALDTNALFTITTQSGFALQSAGFKTIPAWIAQGTVSLTLTNIHQDWIRKAGGTGYDIGYSVATDAFGNLYAAGMFSGTATFGNSTLSSRGGNDIYLVKYDASGNFQWVQQIGGTGDDGGWSIKADSSGNGIYLTGHFSNTATLGNTTLSSQGYADIFVAKYNGSGTLQWAQRAGSSNYDYGFSIAVNPSNTYIYVTGLYRGTATFGNQTITSISFNDDIFVAKYDASNGNNLWARSAGSTSDDAGYGINVDNSDNVYITGYFKTTAIFGNYSISATGGTHGIFIAKYNGTGTVQWARQAGGTDYANDNGGNLVIARSPSVDPIGNVYVTGNISGTATFGNTVTLSSRGSYDVFIAKYNTEGIFQWVQQAGGAGSDNGSGIGADNANNVYVSGTFSSTASFGSTTITSNGSTDIFLVKYNQDGALQWVQQAGGAGNDDGTGLSIALFNDVYVTGRTYNGSNGFDVILLKYVQCPVSTDTCKMFLSLAPTDASCGTTSDGNINLTVAGGTAPFIYNWSNGATTEDLNNVTAAHYGITVTDAKGCSKTGSADINIRGLVLSLTSTNISCNGANNGSTTLTVNGGVAPYTYLWNTWAQTQNIASLSAGTYTVTVTDVNGCTGTNKTTITEPSPLQLSTWTNNISCNGNTDGVIILTVSGGTASYTYSWSNGATTESLYNLSAANYTVTVTDANGCTTTTGVLLTEPTLITATAVATPVSCGGASDGAIDLTVNGGTPPYYYYWSNGFTMEDLSNITTGMYTVSVIDNRGCTTSLTVEVITTDPNCVPVTNTISGKIYHNPACYQNPAASISINLKNENGQPFFLTTTDANGNFAFDPNMLQTIPQNWLVTIGSNSTPLQDMGFQTVSQWISQSPLTIATGENMPLHATWENRVNLATNIYNPYSWPSAIDINGDLVVVGLSNTKFNTWEIVTLKYNTAGNLLWTNKSVPSSSQPALALDNQGNIYVTGNTQGANNALDFVTVKYASDGTELWMNTYNGSGSYSSDNPIDIKTDINGNVYVTGSSSDASGNYDITTVKYNTNGDLLWSKQYNGVNNSEDIPVDMALDNNGNVYVVGRTTTYSGSMSDFVTIKYDNDGNEQWVALYDYSYWFDNPVSITVAQNGDVFVAGRVMSPDNNTDYATIKYSNNGTQQWVKFYTGPTTGFNSNEEPLKIVSDNNNDVYVTGTTWGSTPNQKLATLKYSNSGEKLWERTFTTNGSAKDMAIGSNNSIYITSQYVSIQTGNVDFLTLSYSSEGVQQWWVTYDYQNYSEEPSAICVDNAGNCYVTGSGSSMNYQNVDIVTLRYDACPLMGYSKMSNTKTYSLNEEAKKTAKSNKLKVVQMQANGNQSINVQYYPNPATHELIVKVNVDGNYELNITNLLGQKVITKQFTEKTVLDVSNIRPKGLYFMQIMKDGTQINVGKLVIGE